MAYGNVSINAGGCWDGSTNRFTPNVPGVYWFGWSVATNGLDFAQWAYLHFNGVLTAGLADQPHGSGFYNTQHGNWLLPMNGTTDYVEIYAQQWTGVNKSIGMNWGFRGAWLRPLP